MQVHVYYVYYGDLIICHFWLFNIFSLAPTLPQETRKLASNLDSQSQKSSINRRKYNIIHVHTHTLEVAVLCIGTTMLINTVLIQVLVTDHFW